MLVQKNTFNFGKKIEVTEWSDLIVVTNNWVVTYRSSFYFFCCYLLIGEIREDVFTFCWILNKQDMQIVLRFKA